MYKPAPNGKKEDFYSAVLYCYFLPFSALILDLNASTQANILGKVFHLAAAGTEARDPQTLFPQCD